MLTLLLGAACLEPAAYLEVHGAVDGGAPAYRCTPMTCTGCCDGDVCRGGNTDDACGYDGRACTACPTTHRCEAPGACYSLPMPDTKPTSTSSTSSPPDGGDNVLPPCFPGVAAALPSFCR
ncbi:MAG: hypothetical protein JNK82_30010 [Myxococcaceae bacterium]|nr:hypothetical protein [Myxococcaceae bacterium]